MTTAMHRSDAPRRLRRRPSMLKGRCAIATRRPAAALDPGASAAPDRPTPRAPDGLPRGRAALPSITRPHQSEVSTVSGEAHTVLASAVCAALRRRLTGYHHATPDTLQRRFLSTTGTITNTSDTITVRLNRRTSSPILRQADIPDTTIPWWNNRTLHFEYD